MNSTNRRKAAGSPAAGIVKVIAFITIAALIAVLLVCMTSGTKGGADTSAGAGRTSTPSATQAAKPDKTATPLQNIIESGAAEEQKTDDLIERIKESENTYLFPSPVENWDEIDLTGFAEYDIGEFKIYGGDFPLCLQAYTFAKCREYGISYPLIVGMIQIESSYKYTAVSYDGKCKGFMQINDYWHADRMAKVGAEDLFNPYDNIATGVDFMAELLNRYDGEYLKALAAYNMGATGAYRNLWQYGVYEYSYTDKVTAAAKEIYITIYGGIEQ